MRNDSALLQAMTTQAKKAVQKGFLHLFSANCLTQLLGFGSLIVVTKLLSPEEVGALRIIQSYVSVCLIVAIWGQSSAIIKFCSESRDEAVRRTILRYSIKKSLTVSSIIVGGVWGAVNYGNISQDSVVIKWMPWYIFVIIPNAIFNISLTYLQSVRQFKQIAMVQSILKILSVIVVILLTWQVGISGYVGAVVVMMFLSCLIVMRKIDSRFYQQIRLPIPLGYDFLARVSLCGSVIAIVGSYVDIFFLDYFISDRETVGYYALATIFLMIGTQFVDTVQSFLTPYLAERSHDGLWLWRKMLRYQKYVSLAMLFICPLIYLLVIGLIVFYYGNSYYPVLAFLLVMLVQLWLHTSYSIIGCTLLSINKAQYNLFVVCIVLTIKCILLYIMVTAYGVMGLAYAQVLAELPAIALQYYIAKCVFRKSFGIKCC